jgi:hypothetical protein
MLALAVSLITAIGEAAHRTVSLLLDTTALLVP